MMPEADGQVRIKANLDASNIDADMNKLEKTLIRQTETLQRQSIIVERLTNRYDELRRKAQTIKEPSINSDKMLDNLHVVEQELDLAASKKQRLTDEVNATSAAINRLKSQKVSDFQDKFDNISKSLGNMGNGIKNVFQGALGYVGGIFENLSQKVINFGARILRLAGAAFVFNVISSGFREMTHGIQEIIAHDNQLSASLSQVQANLWTAFYPIYQAILPAIQALGRALSWITGQLASFIAMLTGTSVKANQAGAKAMALQAQNTGKASKALGGQSAGYNKVGKSAKKAKGELASFDKANQKVKGELASFDKIEVLKQNKTASPKSASGAGGGGSGGAMTGSLAGFSQTLENFDSSLMDNIINKFKELAKVFGEGFDMGFVDRNFDDIVDGLERIKVVSGRILNDPNVAEGFNKALFSIIKNLGVITGAVASMGVTIGRLLVGGIAGFIEENEGRIRNDLIRCFNITAELGDFIGELSQAFANISTVFGGEEAQNILSNTLSGLYAIFGTYFLTLYKLASEWIKAIFSPSITHQEEIKEAIRGSLEAISFLTEGLKNILQQVADTISDIYQNSVFPAIKAVGEIWDDVFGIIVDAWNKYINPMLKEMGEKWTETVGGHINPVIKQLGETVGKCISLITEIVKRLWNFLKPFVGWLVEAIFDAVNQRVKDLWDTIMNVLGYIMDAVSGAGKVIEGVIDVISALSAGDWQRAWKGAGRAVEGMVDMAKGAINTLSSLINGVMNLMIGSINSAIRSLNRVGFDVPDFLGGGHVGFNIPEIPKGFANIPRLQKGTILEGGNPFLAWVNDQPRGQTNIETPLSTMVEAFKSALSSSTGGQNIVIEANGDFNQFIRLLNFKLKQEDARIGQSFVTGDAWI